MARIKSFRETGERFPLLRLVASSCNALGTVMLALATLLILGGVGLILVDLVKPTGVVYLGFVALLWSLGFFVASIQFFALGSFLRLAIHVEENTRATAQALDRLRAEVEPKPEVDARSIFLS